MTAITNRRLSLLFLALCAWGPVLQAQEGKGAVVTFDGQPLFEIHSSVGSFSAEARSRELSARMLQVAQDSGIPESAITISDSEDATDVVAKRFTRQSPGTGCSTARGTSSVGWSSRCWEARR